eukprot:6503273-Alexandrium_andersonii.AAC.1
MAGSCPPWHGPCRAGPSTCNRLPRDASCPTELSTRPGQTRPSTPRYPLRRRRPEPLPPPLTSSRTVNVYTRPLPTLRPAPRLSSAGNRIPLRGACRCSRCPLSAEHCSACA